MQAKTDLSRFPKKETHRVRNKLHLCLVFQLGKDLTCEVGIEKHLSSVVVVMSSIGFAVDTIHTVKDVIGIPCHSVKCKHNWYDST